MIHKQENISGQRVQHTRNVTPRSEQGLHGRHMVWDEADRRRSRQGSICACIGVLLGPQIIRGTHCNDMHLGGLNGARSCRDMLATPTGDSEVAGYRKTGKKDAKARGEIADTGAKFKAPLALVSK